MPKLDVFGSETTCPICPVDAAVMVLIERSAVQLRQFHPSEAAIPILDATLECPTCHMRVHKRFQAYEVPK
jgi:hypothetical protein